MFWFSANASSEFHEKVLRVLKRLGVVFTTLSSREDSTRVDWRFDVNVSQKKYFWKALIKDYIECFNHCQDKHSIHVSHKTIYFGRWGLVRNCRFNRPIILI